MAFIYGTDDEVINKRIDQVTCLQGHPWPGVVTVKFPISSYLYLMDGLNKAPSWTVYPTNLRECIEKSTSIIRAGNQG